MADLTALALNAVDTLSVAEIHGVVCGLAIWQDGDFHLQELIDLVGVDALTDESSVEAFVNATDEALRAEDMSFAPLLPDETAPLDGRLDALAEWCAGFLAGFAAAGSPRGLESLDLLPEEVREIVGDLSVITDIDVDAFASADGVGAQGAASDASDGTDAAEADLMQIQEFVKVGVLLILSSITQPAGDVPQ